MAAGDARPPPLVLRTVARGDVTAAAAGPPGPPQLWPWLRAQATPVLLKGYAAGWPLHRWTPAALRGDAATAAKPVRVRWHRRDAADGGKVGGARVVTEGEGRFTDTTLGEACAAVLDPARAPPQATTAGDPAARWTAYVSYHRVHELLGGLPDRLAELDWTGTFGVPDEPEQCAFWVGSAGAGTPCHYDAYGCNLAVQLAGRKRWTLFPPAATADLQPTRVPYEESTVFSGRPGLPGPVAHVSVTLEGDAVFVPHHWWHLVECLEPSVSVNHWLALPEDAEARAHEAVVRHVVGTYVRGALDADGAAAWLNPGETVLEPADEVALLGEALGAVPPAVVAPALLRALTHPDTVMHVLALLREDLGLEVKPTGKRPRLDDADGA